MDKIEQFFQNAINDVDSMTKEESEECLKELKKWENIGPNVKDLFLEDILLERLNSMSKKELKEFVEASPKWGCKSPSMEEFLNEL